MRIKDIKAEARRQAAALALATGVTVEEVPAFAFAQRHMSRAGAFLWCSADVVALGDPR